MSETPKEAARRLMASKLREGYQPEALHVYHDAEGNALHWRMRLKHPQTGDKMIRPMRLTDGMYDLKEPEYPNGKPLYNLHLLARDTEGTVWLVEGEKCADALVGLDVLATTSGSADSVRSANWDTLAGREVVIWPDCDDPGLRYAEEAQTKLRSIGATVKRVDIAALDLPRHGDCVDWLHVFEQQHGRAATRADLYALPLLEAEPGPQQRATSDYFKVGDTDPLPQENYVTVTLQCASDIRPEPISWLWDGWLAKGKLHIFAGTAGTGKTTIAIALASTITTGGRFPDGSLCPKGSVLIWSGEDSASDTLAPRLMAAGADLNKVHFISDATDSEGVRAFDPASDMKALTLAAAAISDLALLIVDPIVNAVAGDSHKNGEVRRALQPIVEFGERLNCAVLGITHFNKGTAGRDPLERVTGSLAFGALARIVLATAKIQEGDRTRRIVCRAKSNIGPDSGGFEYDLMQKELESHAGIFSSYVQWGDAVEGSARDLLAEPDGRESDENGSSALDHAKAFLLSLLSHSEMPQKEIEAEAKGAGIAWATIRRAKVELAVTTTKSKIDHRWYWRLPVSMLKNVEDAQHAHANYVSTLSAFGEFEHLAMDEPLPNVMRI